MLERMSSEVRVALADRVLRYEVTETFVNRGSTVAEADYVFPLPVGAAFEDLKLSINGELVSGETMSADKARGIYEEIVRKQRDPALVEWMGLGMLRARIFPIQPGEEKKVVVRFQSVAQREGDALRIDYRRGTDPNGARTRNTTAERLPREEGDGWSRFYFLYQPGANYGEPYSPTHALRTRDEGRTRQVEARGSSAELTILLPLRRPNAASLSVLAHAPNAERGFALITITPPSAPRRATPRDLTFVIDVSGSMRGRKLEQAKAAGRSLLASLSASDRFRVVDFSTDVRTFRDQWSTATSENVRAANRYIDDLRADGSTNISEALTTALDSRSDGERLPLVVFVTDGEPTVGERNPDAIAAMAARLRGDARVFAVGVSADVNAGLIEQLAVEGHGTAHFVRDSESVERTLSLLARRLTSPVLTNVRLRADGVRLSQLLPSGPIDVFAGQDLILLARYDGHGDATLHLEGRSADGPVTWTTRVDFPDRERNNPFVARLWAAQRIGWLAAEKRKNGGTTELDSEIRSLGERYGIPTEFSSYLVVEPGMQLAATPAAVRRDAATSSPQANGAAGAASTARRERTMSALDVSTTAAPSQPQVSANEARFEAAKASAAQREVKSMASLDSATATVSTQRRAGDRLFALANGVWTDARFSDRLRTVRVKPFSPLYFELVKRLDGAQDAFALGDRVIIAGRSVAIELAPNGLESMPASDLDALERGWR
jgi:Ca-activated chloride channel family protein